MPPNTAVPMPGNMAGPFSNLLPMVQGKISGTPAASGTALQVNPGGQTVYDPVTNVTWLADFNVAASNTFGLPVHRTRTAKDLHRQ